MGLNLQFSKIRLKYDLRKKTGQNNRLHNCFYDNLATFATQGNPFTLQFKTCTAMIMPPFLQQGDLVALVSPSGKIDHGLLKGARQRLEEWGLRVETGKHAGGSHGSYAGTAGQRLHDLQAAMDRPDAKAILCSRGGYGAVQLIDKLRFDRFALHPKWLIGYSDITALHCLWQQRGYASIHAPMARHLAVEPPDDPCTTYLRELLFGHLPTYTCPPHKLNHTGTARGTLRGGNMAVAYGLRATEYDIPPEGTILFLEDVGERPYAVDRMARNLQLGGVLRRIAGLIVGQFTARDGKPDFCQEIYANFAALLRDCHIPVCFGFPVGHVRKNLPLVNGASVTLEVDKKGTRISFTL